MDDLWYSLCDLPAGRVRVRVRWPGYVVVAASDIDKAGNRRWFELVGRDLRPLRAEPEAWQPLDAARWTWPNGIVPAPIRVQVRPSLAIVGGLDFNAVEAALEMEEWREAARAQCDTGPPPDAHAQWWRDVTRVRYEPMGAVSLDHGEARIMRHLILERAMPLDLRRQRSNAAVLADLKLSWADVYGEQSRGDDWEPPLVPQTEDHRDFETVMSWFAEVSPSKREMTVLRGRMLAPPVTWGALGDVIQRSWSGAQQIYRGAITDLVAAANRHPTRGLSRMEELRERNRAARLSSDDTRRRRGAQWWSDASCILYEPTGSVSRYHGEARVMRHLRIGHDALDGAPYLWRPQSNLLWADQGRTGSFNNRFTSPRVGQWASDQKTRVDYDDFDAVAVWFSIAALDERQMAVMHARSTIPPMTWRAIGQAIGVSPERARQIYEAAISKMIDAANSTKARRR